METQVSISEWAKRTFGPPASVQAILDRFLEEVDELERLHPLDRFKLEDECADCLIVLYQVATAAGFDLEDAVYRKMQVNRARQWSVKGDGTGQHK